MMEAIFMAVSVIMGLKFVAGTGSVGYAPTFLYYAVPIYMMFALFPNLLLIKKKNVKFLKMMRSPKQFFKAVFISAVTPFFFGFMVTAVMY